MNNLETQKKKFNKKYLMPLMIVFGIALVTAGLGLYVSNTVQADITVNHPIEQLISTDGVNWEVGDSISFGGEGNPIYADGVTPTTFSIRDENLALVPITGKPDNRVTNPDGVTCDDFVSVILNTETVVGDEIGNSGPHDLIYYESLYPGEFCKIIDANTIIFMYGPNAQTTNEVTLEIEQVDTTNMEIIFNTWAEGTYTFTSNILPA